MRRSLMVAGLAVAAALLSGCGGSGDSQSSTSTSGGVSPTSVGSATSPPASPSSRSAERFCQSTEDLNRRVAAAALSMGEDPSQIRQFVAELLTASEEMAALAPAEIAADTRIITGAVSNFARSIEQGGYDPDRISEDAAAALTGPEVQGASQRMEAYISAQCPTNR